MIWRSHVLFGPKIPELLMVPLRQSIVSGSTGALCTDSKAGSRSTVSPGQVATTCPVGTNVKISPQMGSSRLLLLSQIRSLLTFWRQERAEPLAKRAEWICGVLNYLARFSAESSALQMP